MKVVYHSFEGRFSDSPRALFEAIRTQVPEAEHTWLTGPGSAAGFPAGVRLLEYGSDACVEALAEADALIANTHTDFDWPKRPGTLYLQTWHGTPLKRIHWDVLWAPEGRLDRLQRDVDRWDVLVSPNRVSTPLLRRAFRFGGEVLETGYPRNDVLSSPGRDDVRRAVRAQLGIEDGQTAVLYTPTWRDDVVFAEGGKEFALGLDPAAVADALGPGSVLLLRLHRMLSDRSAAAGHPRVRDVSAMPEISDLYLAADAMVTDYSSTMFDFAVTGKPMVLYTYDLADFRDRLRGFYFDLEQEAPGPLVETQDALVAALRDLPGVAAASGERYERFRRRFSHLEDGRAADRVVERLRRLG
jgi:CDP-glycerol glycerophosphotransferase